jgi:hypothetical protein
MGAVDIGRLRVRGPPHLAAWTTFAIEDACRTVLPDGERLVLVRRLDLGRNARNRRAQAAALRRSYDAATAAARHGGMDGAEAANCVWFASRAEARLLLLAALLAGRRPSAWFWRLAVPDWGGQSAEPWLAREIEAALAGEDAQDIVGLVMLAVEAGAVETLVRVLGGLTAARTRAWPHGAAATSGIAAAAVRRRAREAEAARAAERETVARLRERLPPALVEAVEILVSRIGIAHRASAILVERLLLIASPSLALSPPLLRALVDCWCGEIVPPAPPRASAPEPAEATPRIDPAVPAGETAASRIEEGEGAAPLVDAAPKAAPTLEQPASAPAEPAARPPRCDPSEERRSAAAGLWLAIPALIHMGLREWLEARPTLLCGDPGRALIRTIAAHHLVLPDDPALAPLALPAGEFEPPLWALPWRAGLDRWLRRRAHVPLDRLVWRAGWLRLVDDRLAVRFPPQAADIRLRRHALDVDPGWTGWLGLSVRYLYAERTGW